MKRYNIIRILLILAAVTVCLTLLISCRASNPTDLLAELCSLYEDTPPLSVYFSDAPEDSEGYMSAELMRTIYGENTIPYGTSYAVAMTETTRLFEIHIITPQNSYDREEIMRLLEKRLDIIRRGELSEFSPRIYYSTVEQAEILRTRRHIMLTVTHDNSRIKQYLGIKE